MRAVVIPCLPLLSGCLFSDPEMDGDWSGMIGDITIEISLEETSGTIIGTAVFMVPDPLTDGRSYHAGTQMRVVEGDHAHPSVSLRFLPGTYDLANWPADQEPVTVRFSGNFETDRLVTGRLSGGPFLVQWDVISFMAQDEAPGSSKRR